MTIQRQYILPNCSLVLEGLSADASNVLSILANAEFKVVGIEQPLAGGSEFFKAIVVAVSAYSQRLLSGLEHPEHGASQSPIAVERSEGQYHRLIIKPELLNESADQSGNQSADQSAPQAINLSTVQLFDMVEAIDQFLADGTALPEMKQAIAPLSKRDVPSQVPVAQRVAAPALGATGLAIAAAALFALPAPEIMRPVEGETAQVESVSETDGGEVAAGGASGDDELELPENLITDEIVIGAIQADLQSQLDSAWTESLGTTENLTYRVTTGEDGTILGYAGLDEISREYESKPPLLDELYISAEGGSLEDQPLAQFKVSFIGDSTLEVEPFEVEDLNTSSSTSAAVTLSAPADAEEELEEEIELAEEDEPEATADADEISEESAADDSSSTDLSEAAGLVEADSLSASDAEDLTATLYDAIDQAWTKSPSFDGALEYRVQVASDGDVVGFEALTADGNDFLSDLPLGELKTAAKPDEVAEFKVLFRPSGVLEVSPWDGF